MPIRVLVNRLVVAQVEIGLGAVIGHEHLAVLERAHCPRIDVDVGIELLVGHPEPPALQRPQRSRLPPVPYRGKREPRL